LYSRSEAASHLKVAAANGELVNENHCFLFALQRCDGEPILDAYLVVASDRDCADKALRHARGVTRLGKTSCLGEWARDQIAARCWIEGTLEPLTCVSVHSLAEIMWD
jgi:hypothetical protein